MSRKRDRDQPVTWMLLARATPFLPVERQPYAVPGSTVEKANCGHWVLLSPQGRRQFESAYTMCVDCDLASADSVHLGKMPGKRYAVPGGIEAATAGLSQHQLDQVQAWIKEMGIKEL